MQYGYGSQGHIDITTSFDTSVFGEVETLASIMQFKDIKRNMWESCTVGGSFTAAPLLYNGCLYFGAYDKNFYCLTQDGNVKWKFQAEERIGFHAIAHGGIIYFPCADGCLYAVDETSRLAWKFETQGPLGCPPLYNNSRLYFGSSDTNVYCVDAKSGKEIWRFHTHGSQSITIPCLYNGRLYFGNGDNTLYCTDLDGNLLWKFHAKGEVAAFPAVVRDNTVYFGCWDNHIYAVDAETGSLKWKFEAGESTYCPIVDEDRLYCGSRDNNLYCLNLKGKVLWKFPTQGYVVFSAVRGNVIYFGSWDQILRAVDKFTGKLLWKFQTNGLLEEVSVYGDRVYAPCWDCNLYCLDLQGNLVWKFPSSLSSPSKVLPPPPSFMKTAQIVVHIPESGSEESRYKAEKTMGGGKSPYKAGARYVQKSRYVGDTSRYA